MNIYHCSSNLVIVWIKFYLPEEIMDIVLRWADPLWQKDMEMVHKILRRGKKKEHQDLVSWVLLLSPINNRFAPLATWNRISGVSRRTDNILCTGEHQVSSIICGLMGNTSKQGPSKVQMFFSMGGEVLQEPQGHPERKNAANPQQGPLWKADTNICKTSLRCSSHYCCEDSKSKGGTRGEILPSKVGIPAPGKKKLSIFLFLNSCCAGHDVCPKAAASRKPIGTSKAWKDWHVHKTWQTHGKEENRKSWLTPEVQRMPITLLMGHS